jgi:NDP-sugar pyrophosphorylase family protein
MNSKYALTNETKKSPFGHRVLHRIQALRDIGDDVKKGDLGGWIECELNLSTFGESWIYNEAVCYYDARVSRNAQLRDRAACWAGGYIGDFSIVSDDVSVLGGGRVEDYARASDHAEIGPGVRIYDRAKISGWAKPVPNAQIGQDTVVHSETPPPDIPSPVAARKAARNKHR